MVQLVQATRPRRLIRGQIELRDLATLNAQARNPRTHSKQQIQQLADSLRRFGFVSPILIDRNNTIIAGHGRAAGAELAGFTRVPTLRVGHLSEAEIRAYVIADNKLAEKAGWDKGLLALELQALSVELDFSLTDLGFEVPEVDLLLQSPEPDVEPAVPALESGAPAVSRQGDLWLIGDHRLYCGDALNPVSYQQLLGSEKAGCVFTDPPYNVPIDGHVSGLGAVSHREFAMASGEMTPAEFQRFLLAAFQNMASVCRNGALNYICMDWRHARDLLEAGALAYTELKNLCVWAKTNAGMGSLYRSQHELVFVFKHGQGPHTNNVELGKHGRNRTNVWNYAGMNTFGKDRNDELAMHPTVKPVAMVADAILDASVRGDIVLDPFCGSGTTLLAAHKTGRRGFGIELDPLYVDLIVRRLRDICGLEARLQSTGELFTEMAAGRQRAPQTADV